MRTTLVDLKEDDTRDGFIMLIEGSGSDIVQLRTVYGSENETKRERMEEDRQEQRVGSTSRCAIHAQPPASKLSSKLMRPTPRAAWRAASVLCQQ